MPPLCSQAIRLVVMRDSYPELANVASASQSSRSGHCERAYIGHIQPRPGVHQGLGIGRHCWREVG